MSSTNNSVTTQAAVQASSVPAGQVQTSPSIVESLVPIVLMLIAFYFLLIRPAQKRETKRKRMISLIKRGDKVITTSGIIGRIHKQINDMEISLEITEGVRVRMLKSSILEILDKNSKIGSDEIENTEGEFTKKQVQKDKKEEIA